MTKPDCDCSTGQPHDSRQNKRRDNVPGASLERGTRGFAPGPLSLTRNERDGNPVVRDHRVQHTDDQDGAYQQRRRSGFEMEERENAHWSS